MPKSSSSEKKCSADCPIARISEILGDFWVLLILQYVSQKPMRFNEIQEMTGCPSTNTLTIKLKKLTEYGLLQRVQYPQIPPRVEYSLTEKGEKLKPLLKHLEGLEGEV